MAVYNEDYIECRNSIVFYLYSHQNLLTESLEHCIMYLYLIQMQNRHFTLFRAGDDARRFAKMDTKFSVAVHVLILISESPNPISSDQMAESVGTNASYIRKILALLKKAEIVDSHRGISGYSLTVAPEQLTLFQVYQAVMEESKLHLLDIHQNPNDQCIVGRHIKPVLTGMFADIEEGFARSLAGKTLADCIADIRKRIS